MDFLRELHNDFDTVVVMKLGERSRKAINNKEDPDSMKEDEKRRIKREIKETVYGK